MKKENKFFIRITIVLGIMLLLFNNCKKKEDPILIIESSVTDNEGNRYKAVSIGSQVWMAENLKVTKYQNGDLIGTTNPYRLNIENENSAKYQWVNVDGARPDEVFNLANYGRLYTWHVVKDIRKICPSSWHIPSHSEWVQLIDYVGGQEIAADILKEAGYTHWKTPNTATNKYGFSALGGGSRALDGGTGNLTMFGVWWSDTEYELEPAKARSEIMYNDMPNLMFGGSFKNLGHSVRCIKD